MAGLGQFITDIGTTTKNNNFLFHEPHSKNLYFTSYDVLFSHMTVTGSSLRRSTRRFASLLSPPLATNIVRDMAMDENRMQKLCAS